MKMTGRIAANSEIFAYLYWENGKEITIITLTKKCDGQWRVFENSEANV